MKPYGQRKEWGDEPRIERRNIAFGKKPKKKVNRHWKKRERKTPTEE